MLLAQGAIAPGCIEIDRGQSFKRGYVFAAGTMTHSAPLFIRSACSRYVNEL
jgi:hypothetical protein